MNSNPPKVVNKKKKIGIQEIKCLRARVKIMRTASVTKVGYF